jgi:hypothetical protein
MNIKNTVVSALILAALTFTLPAGATEVVTTSYTSWTTTTSGSVAEWDFSIPFNTYNTAAGYDLNVGSFGPVNVTAPDNGSYNLQKNPGYGPSNNVALQGPSDGLGTMNFVTPSAGLTAFSLGLGITGNAAPITITMSDGETFTVSPAVNGNAFIGFSSATAITSFSLSTLNGSSVNLTDFLTGMSNEPADTGSSPTAEVATALMIGSGLLFFGGCRKVYSNLSTAKA